jgi:hypothetical protein
VCMFVCTFTAVYPDLCACLYAFLQPSPLVCAYVCIHVYCRLPESVCRFVCIFTAVYPGLCVCLHTFLYAFLLPSALVFAYVCMHFYCRLPWSVSMFACIFTAVYPGLRVCLYAVLQPSRYTNRLQGIPAAFDQPLIHLKPHLIRLKPHAYCLSYPTLQK